MGSLEPLRVKLSLIYTLLIWSKTRIVRIIRIALYNFMIYYNVAKIQFITHYSMVIEPFIDSIFPVKRTLVAIALPRTIPVLECAVIAVWLVFT